MIRIDVCVATRKRPELLSELLSSLVRQQRPSELEVRVIVVDNDAERSAEPVALQFQDSGLEVVYAVEPERNISLARNRGISLATAEYVATIDDDATASRDWLVLMLRCAQHYRADVVFGAVERVLPRDAPEWIRASGVFQLPNPPTGTSTGLVFNTINALFRRGLVERRPGPFDPRFGETGGEDTNLFFNLEREGARLVWCREAVVTETVLPGRVSLWWIMQRALREGMTYFRVYKRWDIKPDAPFVHRYFHLLLWVARICLRIVYYAAIGIARRDSWAVAVRHLRELSFNVGIAAEAAGFRYQEYRG